MVRDEPFRNGWSRELAVGTAIVLSVALLEWTSPFYTGPHGATAWHPATGLALYVVFRMGARTVPWLLAGLLIAEMWSWDRLTGVMMLVPPVLKLAVIVPAAVWMRRGTSGDRLNCEPREIIHFLVMAVSVSVMLSLLVNAFLLAVGGPDRTAIGAMGAGDGFWSFFMRRVGGWAMGDLIGTLLLFPLAFVLEQLRLRHRMRTASSARGTEEDAGRRRLVVLAEALLYLAAIVLLVRFVLLSPWGWHFNLLFLAFLIIVPVSIRHGFAGAVLVAVAIDAAGLAVVALSNVRFVMQHNPAVFLVFQLFMMALVITGMFLGAAFDQIRLAREELLRAKTVAEEASRAKTRFLQNVGHELRTPLNAILGFAQMMADETLGPLGVPRYRDYLRDILGAGRHLLGLVDRLLAVAAEDGREESPDVGPLAPVPLARRAVEMIAPRAEARSVRLSLDAQGTLPAVLGEEGRLLQILLNLLDNAIKHGPRGGTVRLRVDMVGACPETARDAGAASVPAAGASGVPAAAPDLFVRFAVEDEGAGVPAAERDRIFERFARLDAGYTAGSGGGMGLGLHIVRTLVEQMGGRVRVEDASGGGARFVVELPAVDRDGR